MSVSGQSINSLKLYESLIAMVLTARKEASKLLRLANENMAKSASESAGDSLKGEG